MILHNIDDRLAEIAKRLKEENLNIFTYEFICDNDEALAFAKQEKLILMSEEDILLSLKNKGRKEMDGLN